MGCLYRITLPTGMAYVGITAKSAEERFKVHAYEARRGTKGRLYNALRKSGVESAIVETLVIADGWEYLCDLEKRAIVAFQTRSPRGLNMTDGGDGAPIGHSYRVGLKHSPEARAKMAAAKTGRPRTEATKAKISAASKGNRYNVGRRASEETKAKMAAAHRGKIRTQEQRENIAAAARLREARKRESRKGEL